MQYERVLEGGGGGGGGAGDSMHGYCDAKYHDVM